MGFAISRPTPAPLASRLKDVNQKMDDICRLSGVPGASVGIIHDKRIIHTHNYGFADVERKIAASSDTIYGIGSVTKVRDVLPGFEHDDPVVNDMLTVTDILSHRGGLAGSGTMSLAFQGDGDMLLPRDKLLELVNHFPVLFPIRQSWDYFVWGYSLAGLIVEEITGKSLQDFISETLLSPLGMNDTALKLQALDPKRLAEPYSALADGTPFHLTRRQVFEDTFFEASGGLFSTRNDLLNWALATLEAINETSSGSAKASSSTVLKQMPYIMSNHAAVLNPSMRERSCGLGWVRTQLPGAAGVIGDNFPLWTTVGDQPILGDKDHPLLMIYHQGSTVGYYSHIALFPDTNSAVVILTNSIALSDAPDWISRVIIQAMFGLRDGGHDYVRLAREANSRQIAEFQTVADQISAKRLQSCSSAAPPNLGASTRTTLELRFQGLETQAYELRYLCDNVVFEWSLTHDENKKRGRYTIAALEYFLFTFKLDREGKPASISWVTDPLQPQMAEEFFLEVQPGLLLMDNTDLKLNPDPTS
ncbi:beta-lactamase/transpeptidase-like protein [Rhypophila decipiens]|uniref:Beta-lactamase/transpeptidase-like protein n=1 Tax=Rhypophila decipiens TaxID=261697 RepID=A0AAN7B7S2_9PEZI|nr:beta-lactamase/transpeptidase-like protein [Rhypophila decipiens]